MINIATLGPKETFSDLVAKQNNNKLETTRIAKNNN